MPRPSPGAGTLMNDEIYASVFSCPGTYCDAVTEVMSGFASHSFSASLLLAGPASDALGDHDAVPCRSRRSMLRANCVCS
jgi:hypothetical protein